MSAPEFKFNANPPPPGGEDWKLLRPRDAATLMIIDSKGDEPKVLMGRRHESHRFMPGKYVFPGGRVDPADQRLKGVGDFAPHVRDKLLYRMRGPASGAKVRGLALAAIRETLEETGLLIGEKSDTPLSTRAESWRPFVAHKVVPRLDKLIYLARAVTPPRRPRRFDTRFFAVGADAIAERADFEETDEDELLELNWLTFNEARDLDLPNITRFVLALLEDRLASGDVAAAEHKVPYFYMQGRRSVREDI